jgi:hypothetical protein
MPPPADAQSSRLFDSRHWTAQLTNLSPFRFGCLLFLLGSGVRIGLMVATRYYKVDPDLNREIMRIVAQLAAGGSFSNPYLCATGPTAHAAPGFPFVLALLYRVFETGVARDVAICIVGCIVSSASYALLPWLAEALGFPRRAGRWAGLAGSAVPLYFWVEARGVLDAPYIALALVVGVSLTLKARTFRELAGAGVAWGAGFWFAPSALPVMALCAGVVFWRWIERRGAGIAVAALCAPAIVLIAPWIVRNYAEFHHWFWVRDNLGLELRLSNNSNAHALESVNREQGLFKLLHPNDSAAACRRVQQVGEFEAFNQDGRVAYQWIRSHPVEFGRLAIQRTFYFWMVPLPSMLKRLTSVVITLLAFGAVFLYRREFPGRMLGGILLLYSCIYCFVQVEARYRQPLHAFTLMGAAATAVWLWDRWTGRRACGSREC